MRRNIESAGKRCLKINSHLWWLQFDANKSVASKWKCDFWRQRSTRTTILSPDDNHMKWIFIDSNNIVNVKYRPILDNTLLSSGVVSCDISLCKESTSFFFLVSLFSGIVYQNKRRHASLFRRSSNQWQYL